MNQKGEFNWFVLVMGIPLIAILIAAVPAIDVLGQQVSTQLDATTATFYINLCKLVVGLFVFVLILGVIWVSASSIREERRYLGG